MMIGVECNHVQGFCNPLACPFSRNEQLENLGSLGGAGIQQGALALTSFSPAYLD